DHAPAQVGENFALGRVLLARGEAAGRAALERAVQRDPTARAAAYHLIKTYYEREGRQEEARAYQQRAWDEGERMANAEEERKAVTPADAFLPHALDPAALAARSEEHTSELQSRFDLVCRLLLEKKKLI